ncbi:MAG: hypothetical protein KF886_21950 [Candidatus Hydrogenedentes bacterium]|nr:hypothetical protein [Candidatus Hydrogenedentota bacterium]
MAALCAVGLAGCPELPEPPEDAAVASVSPLLFRSHPDGLRKSVSDLAIAPDGAMYVTGTRNVFSLGEAAQYVMKLDSAGQLLWTRTYGGPGVSEGFEILAEPDGGFVAAGATRSSGAGRFDAYFVSAGPDGEERWSHTYGGDGYDFAHTVVRTPDGGYALAGYTRSFGAGKMDMYLIKTDGAGNEEWSQTYGTARYEGAHGLCATRDGGYALLGFQGDSEFDSYSSASRTYLVRTDASGAQRWARALPLLEFSEGYDLQETDDGGFIIVGDAGFSGFFTKVDGSGNVIWTREPGLYQYGTDLVRIHPARDGGFMLVGNIDKHIAEGGREVFLMKLTRAGNVSWRARVRTARNTYGTSVIEGEDGVYTVAGFELDDMYTSPEEVFVLRARAP